MFSGSLVGVYEAMEWIVLHWQARILLETSERGLLVVVSKLLVSGRQRSVEGRDKGCEARWQARAVSSSRYRSQPHKLAYQRPW